LHEEFLIVGDIDFFIGSSDRVQEIFRHDAVRAVGLGVKDERHIIKAYRVDTVLIIGGASDLFL
jgi:hypothetical protein